MTNEEFFESIEDSEKSTIEDSLNQVRYDAYNEGYKKANLDKALDPYGMKNINFSLELNENDTRKELFKKQRLERGFDDTELWNLDMTILKFILPRLKLFKEKTGNYPPELKSAEEWDACIDKMIKSIESILTDSFDADFEGFELFKKYFLDLWW